MASPAFWLCVTAARYANGVERTQTCLTQMKHTAMCFKRGTRNQQASEKTASMRGEGRGLPNRFSRLLDCTGTYTTCWPQVKGVHTIALHTFAIGKDRSEAEGFRCEPLPSQPQKPSTSGSCPRPHSPSQAHTFWSVCLNLPPKQKLHQKQKQHEKPFPNNPILHPSMLHIAKPHFEQSRTVLPLQLTTAPHPQHHTYHKHSHL